MLWALSLDILGWLILEPLTGGHPIHELIGKLSTPWGFVLEMLFAVAVLLALGLKGRAAQNRAL